MSRESVDYYENGQHILRIGKVNYDRAHKPLDAHVHKNRIELTAVLKGRQIYQVNNVNYEVKSGEIFFTFPNEIHGSAGNPEDKANFYYLIFNPDLLIKQSYLCTEIDSEYLQTLINTNQKRVFKGSEKINEYFGYILSICSGSGPLRHTLVRNYLSLLIIELFSIQGSNMEEKENDMAAIQTYIQQNLSRSIPLSALAEKYGVSLSRFKILFKKETGMPPREYILREKIDAAKNMLRTTDLSVTDIAMALGFSSGQYFATVFKRFVYLSPSEYRSRCLHTKPHSSDWGADLPGV